MNELISTANEITKEIPENKIDGAVALMMAIGRIMLSTDDENFFPNEVVEL